jgi:IMP dehydrogenase
MKEYANFKRLCFDDILLVPQHSDIESRRQVNLSSGIGKSGRGFATSIPVIAAPMDTVCEWQMAVKLRRLGGLGVIHRYMSIEDQVIQYSMVRAHKEAAGVAIGATGDYIDRAWQLATAGCKLLLVDTANGHSQYAIDAVKKIRQVFGRDVHIMAGNVATYEGFARLQDAGADSIRVGIGGGSVCTTRLVSGHGVPTLASIMDIRERIPYGEGASLIADGGIKNSGDAAKALAAGADVVMLGSMLAGTDESPGEIITEGGKVNFQVNYTYPSYMTSNSVDVPEEKKYKLFRGMASREAQVDGRGFSSVVEGVATKIPYKGSVEKVITEFTGGLGSALSYSGARNLREFYEESEYVRVTHSSLTESRPHAHKA